MQQALINRWDKGGKYNRPPFLYPPARPASSSNHVKDGGIAEDVVDWQRFAVIAANYGFNHLYPGNDPVHFEFVGVQNVGLPEFDQDTLNRQNFLNTLGYGLVPDGREGPRTKEAYKKYQTFLRAYGYSGAIDGKWGNLTQAAHQKYYDSVIAPKSKHATISNGSQGSAVRTWQLYLKNNYPLYAGKLKVDGDFADDTEVKTKEWQRRSGLKDDGVVGPKSWAKSGL